jgi:hypothetical protein
MRLAFVVALVAISFHAAGCVYEVKSTDTAAPPTPVAVPQVSPEAQPGEPAPIVDDGTVDPPPVTPEIKPAEEQPAEQKDEVSR